jgi:protein-L-isoaspartate(D-aspartate) O-methyltransferase
MLTPKVVGRMLQALAVQPGDRVLEVGTGSGYVTACLTRLGGRVATVEIQPQLAAAARERLTRLGFDRVEVREGDALAEPSPGGPFDVIAVTGSVPGSESLSLLEDQLAPGGRLFCIIGVPPIMEAWLVTRVVGHEFRREALFETCAPTLANCTEPQGFVF